MEFHLWTLILIYLCTFSLSVPHNIKYEYQKKSRTESEKECNSLLITLLVQQMGLEWTPYRQLDR